MKQMRKKKRTKPTCRAIVVGLASRQGAKQSFQDRDMHAIRALMPIMTHVSQFPSWHACYQSADAGHDPCQPVSIMTCMISERWCRSWPMSASFHRDMHDIRALMPIMTRVCQLPSWHAWYQSADAGRDLCRPASLRWIKFVTTRNYVKWSILFTIVTLF